MGEELLPEGFVYGDAFGEVVEAGGKGLFAGVADGVGGVEGWRGVEVGEDGFGSGVEGGGIGCEVGQVDGEEDLGGAGFAERVARDLVGGKAAGEHGGEEVERQGEP